MKTIFKTAVLITCAVLVFLLDLLVVPEADAIYGVRRRTARRTAVVVGSAYSAQAAQTAAAQQQAAAAEAEAAAAQQQAAAAQQQAAAAQQQAAAPPAGSLPIGSVVSALPGGCSQKAIGGVEYQYCGGNYYRAAFQGTQLVYVTAQP